MSLSRLSRGAKQWNPYRLFVLGNTSVDAFKLFNIVLQSPQEPFGMLGREYNPTFNPCFRNPRQHSYEIKYKLGMRMINNDQVRIYPFRNFFI